MMHHNPQVLMRDFADRSNYETAITVDIKKSLGEIFVAAQAHFQSSNSTSAQLFDILNGIEGDGERTTITPRFDVDYLLIDLFELRNTNRPSYNTLLDGAISQKHTLGSLALMFNSDSISS